MTLQTLGEDEIDTEALQAQIDLSMSFAQDLVTSWIKPSHKLVLNSHRDTERELQEYMRRPARLGVGAPIPESATLSKETARLKNHLVNKAGKKRAREEEDDVKKQVSDDDDDEDSRARAIRKKVKPDPFGGTGNGSSNGIGKKKKKAEPNGIPTLQSTPRPSQGSSPVRAGGSGMEFDDGDEGKGLGPPLIDLKVTSSGLSLSKRKKKKNRKKSLPDLAPPLPTLPSSGDRISSNFGVEVIEPVPTTPPKVKQNEFNTPLKSPEVLDISLITTPYALPSPIRRMTTSPVSHLKQPLLNLDGPPLAYEDSENDGNHGTPAASPKKKRKRRRKRKTSLVNGTSDGAHQEA